MKRLRKIKKVLISVEYLADLLKNKDDYQALKVTGGLPEDAEVLEINFDQGSTRNEVAVIFISDTFPEIAEGARVPVLNPVFSSVPCLKGSEPKDHAASWPLDGEQPEGLGY